MEVCNVGKIESGVYVSGFRKSGLGCLKIIPDDGDVSFVAFDPRYRREMFVNPNCDLEWGGTEEVKELLLGSLIYFERGSALDDEMDIAACWTIEKNYLESVNQVCDRVKEYLGVLPKLKDDTGIIKNEF